MPNKATATRRKEKLQVTDDEIWHMRITGMTIDTIARKIGRTGAWVCMRLKDLRLKHREKQFDRMDEYNLEHIAQLEFIRQEALKAWDVSLKEQKEVSIVSERSRKNPDWFEKVKTEVKRSPMGDARLLQVALKANEDIQKIMLGESDKKKQINEDDVQQVIVYNIPRNGREQTNN
jgi:hypothetical protein